MPTNGDEFGLLCLGLSVKKAMGYHITHLIPEWLKTRVSLPFGWEFIIIGSQTDK